MEKEMKLTKKQVAKAKRIVNADNRVVAKELKGERKTLKEVINWIGSGECPACESYRVWLGLDKTNNKRTRNRALDKIMRNTPYVVGVYTLVAGVNADDADAVYYKTITSIPCRKSGKIYADMIDAVIDAKRNYDTITAIRNEVARVAINTRAKLQVAGEYHERAGNVINYIKHNAPDKVNQVVVREIHVNDM